MTKSIGAAVVVLAFIFGDLIPIVSVAAAPLQATVRRPSSGVAELGTRRRIRHYPRYAYRTCAAILPGQALLLRAGAVRRV
jgi:hypothetical protein